MSIGRIVCITGGTGFRHVARELVKQTQDTTYIINVADSGRSTRQLRLFFDMPAIGDIRSRLLDLADRYKPGYEEITKLLMHRLGVDPIFSDPKSEFESIYQKENPLMKNLYDHRVVPRGFANIIWAHLDNFKVACDSTEIVRKEEFDFNNGSIGNFFLAGAYLFYGRNLETAIYLYKVLANVQGEVIPATTENIHLAAKLEDGSQIVGQHLITQKTSLSPIADLFYLDREDLNTGRVIEPKINPEAAAAIREADMLVISMGSFYTSILSNVHLMGMSEAVRESKAFKLFIANPTEDAETRGMTAGTMASKIIETLRIKDSAPSSNDQDYLQMVLVNNHKEAPSFRDGFNDLSTERSKLSNKIKILSHPLLDDSGHYKPEILAKALMELQSLHTKS
jgi:CofD-related protein of GAK system